MNVAESDYWSSEISDSELDAIADMGDVMLHSDLPSCYETYFEPTWENPNPWLFPEPPMGFPRYNLRSNKDCLWKLTQDT
jgi:hypothetical protein